MLRPPGRPGPRRGSSRGARGTGSRSWGDAEAGDDDIPPARWAPRDEEEATQAYPAFIDGSDDGSGFDESTSDALDHAVDDNAERRAYVDEEGFAYEGDSDEADDEDEVEADVAAEDEADEGEADDGDADGEADADEGDADADEDDTDEWVDAEAEAIDADVGTFDEAVVEEEYEDDLPDDRSARDTGAAGYDDGPDAFAGPSATRTPRAGFDDTDYDDATTTTTATVPPAPAPTPSAPTFGPARRCGPRRRPGAGSAEVRRRVRRSDGHRRHPAPSS